MNTTTIVEYDLRYTMLGVEGLIAGIRLRRVSTFARSALLGVYSLRAQRVRLFQLRAEILNWTADGIAVLYQIRIRTNINMISEIRVYVAIYCWSGPKCPIGHRPKP